MKKYYRIMLGKKSAFAEQCFAGSFIGADFDIAVDLSGKLPEEWRDFNRAFIPMWLAAHPGKSKISAGLSCGFLWTIAKGIRIGDDVLCPDGKGTYRVGEVVGDYQYAAGQVLPHRRAVKWLSESIDRADMGGALRNSVGSIGTVSDVSDYHEEILRLIGESPTIISTNPEVEDPIAFALEEHLEEFLVKNWEQTEFAKDYSIFEEDGEKKGRQYQTDAGRIDILAIRKDRKELLVVELKKGRATDTVVGQILRYMGYVAEELAEERQQVRGLIIGFEDDPKLRRALAVSPNVRFRRYEVNFRLV